MPFIDPWDDLDHEILGFFVDSPRSRSDLLRHFADVGSRHISISIASHVSAGRLSTVRNAVRTSWRITPAGLAHLRQTTTEHAEVA